jgi:hypothetical protein
MQFWLGFNTQLQHFVHIFVGEAIGGFDVDWGQWCRLQYRRLAVRHHAKAKGTAGLPLQQAHGPSGQLRREHGNHAGGQINGGATAAGFQIQVISRGPASGWDRQCESKSAVVPAPEFQR